MTPMRWWHWFAWGPLSKCRWCGRRFLRHWPWSVFEEACSKACNDEMMDAIDDGCVL